MITKFVLKKICLKVKNSPSCYVILYFFAAICDIKSKVKAKVNKWLIVNKQNKKTDIEFQHKILCLKSY